MTRCPRDPQPREAPESGKNIFVNRKKIKTLPWASGCMASRGQDTLVIKYSGLPIKTTSNNILSSKLGHLLCSIQIMDDI